MCTAEALLQSAAARATCSHGNYLIPGARGDIVYRIAEIRGEVRHAALDALSAAGRDSVTSGHRGARRRWRGEPCQLRRSAAGDDHRGRISVGIDRLHARIPEPATGRSTILQAAIAFVKCHARELGIDADRIALLGEDSGADLVTRAAARDHSLKAVVLAGLRHSDRRCRHDRRQRSSFTAAPMKTCRSRARKPGVTPDPQSPAISSQWQARRIEWRTGTRRSGLTRRSSWCG